MSKFLTLTEIGIHLGMSSRQCGDVLKKSGFRTPKGEPSAFSLEHNLCQPSTKAILRPVGSLYEVVFFKWRQIVCDFLIMLKDEGRIGESVRRVEFFDFMDNRIRAKHYDDFFSAKNAELATLLDCTKKKKTKTARL